MHLLEANRNPYSLIPVVFIYSCSTEPCERFHFFGHNKNGFAVISVLLLLSFIFLLGVTLHLSFRVELVARQNGIEELLAEKYALFSAQLAIGDLAQHLSKDTGVAAYGESLLEFSEEKDHWLQTWDTLAEKEEGNWLVSNWPSTNNIFHTFFEKEPSEITVKVPAFGKQDGLSELEFSYWVVDEGMKVPVSYLEKFSNKEDFAKYSTMEIQRLRQEGASVLSPEKIFLRESEEALPDEIEMTEKDKLCPIYWIKEQSVSPRIPITFQSNMLLTDTAKGGLRKNVLSPEPYQEKQNEAFSLDRSVLSFLQHRPNSNGKFLPRGLPDQYEELEEGSPINSQPFIITEVSLQIKVLPQGRGGWSRNRLRFYLGFQLELWSPYGLSPEWVPLKVVIKNFPPIHLRYSTDGSEHQDPYSESYQLDFTDEELTFTPVTTPNWQAGELRDNLALQLVDSSHSERVGLRYHRTKFWRVPSSNGLRQLDFSVEDEAISIVLESADYSGNESKMLGTIQNIPLTAIQKTINLDADDHVVPFHLHYKVKSNWTVEDESKVAPLETILSGIDLRQPILNLEQRMEDANSIVEIRTESTNDQAIDETVFLHDTFLSGQNTNFFHRLYDLPQQTPISMGWLSHLSVKGYPPFAIGNPSGRELNKVFDQYFMVDLHNHEDELPDLHNPYLRPLLPIEDNKIPKADKLLWQAINLNQSNPHVWEAILCGATIEDWAYQKNQHAEPSSIRPVVHNSFSRLPHSAEVNSTSFSGKQGWAFELSKNYPKLTDSEKIPTWTHSLSHSNDLERIWNFSCSKGIREYSDEQMEDLAQAISSEYEKRERPFFSTEELVNSGLLQKAIDQTDLNTLVEGLSYEDAQPALRIPKMSNLYLSQSDLMMRLAPIMSLRSDTFTIYAKAIHRLEESTIEKNLMLVVQRMVSRDNLENRVWKIISHEWR